FGLYLSARLCSSGVELLSLVCSCLDLLVEALDHLGWISHVLVSFELLLDYCIRTLFALFF
ncbi:Unknown protein, partial [Striga hermonthica]